MVTKVEKVKDEPKRSEGDVIWDEIKDVPINMYALPNQTVKDHVTRRSIPADYVILKPKSPAVIASLGEAIGYDKYVCNALENGTITIERVKTAESDEEEEYMTFPRPNGKVYKIKKSSM